MKKIKKLLIYVIIIFLSVMNIIPALEQNTIPNYKQVTNIGGSNSKDGVEVSKIISETETENFFDITLSVKTESKIDEILTDQDLAIIVVMDISYSMSENKVSSGETRLSAAQNAADNLITDFAIYSNSTIAKRELGFVAFNTNAHEIFPLQENKTQEKAKELTKKMNTTTNDIATRDWWPSHNRFTNIEAGLQMAYDMLSKSTIKNKYIIFLSDGYPTTYLNNTTKELYDGYDPYMNDTLTESEEGKFYNEITKKTCTHGTSYSDRAAKKASELATNIKSKDITIFSIGVGIDSQKSITTLQANDNKSTYSVVDTETTDYEIGQSISEFKDWLKNDIASGYYYDTDSITSLKEAYADIFTKVKEMSEETAIATWVIEDPMSDDTTSNIEFIGLYDDTNTIQLTLNTKNKNQSDTATFSNNKINWDLKNSTYIKITEGTKTAYYYEIKYRIRLTNESSNFDINTIYPTNGKTTLTYVTRTNGILSENKTIDFPIPSIIGYNNNLSFFKKSSHNNKPLSNVEFTLSHDTNCSCQKGYLNKTSTNINIKDVTTTSDNLGKVSFNNIPSGHTYILKETKTPSNYQKSSSKIIEIAYGQIINNPFEDNTILNKLKTTNLTISKQIKGQTDHNGPFSFYLKIYLDNELITNNYKYIKNNKEEGTINLSDAILTLNNNESITIYDLPVGATYEITETTTSGFTVQNIINQKINSLSSQAICNESNNCYLTEDKSNTIEFINIYEPTLPKTGQTKLPIISLFITGLISLIIGIYKVIRNKHEE